MGSQCLSAPAKQFFPVFQEEGGPFKRHGAWAEPKGRVKLTEEQNLASMAPFGNPLRKVFLRGSPVGDCVNSEEMNKRNGHI